VAAPVAALAAAAPAATDTAVSFAARAISARRTSDMVSWAHPGRSGPRIPNPCQETMNGFAVKFCPVARNALIGG